MYKYADVAKTRTPSANMIKSVAILSALVASAAASTLKFCDDKVCINGVREKGVDTCKFSGDFCPHHKF